MLNSGVPLAFRPCLLGQSLGRLLECAVGCKAHEVDGIAALGMALATEPPIGGAVQPIIAAALWAGALPFMA